MAKPDGMEVLGILVGAVQQRYEQDPTGASVTMGFNHGTYYASVVRYAAKYGRERTIVCNARGATMEEAVRALADLWLAKIQVSDRVRTSVLRVASVVR